MPLTVAHVEHPVLVRFDLGVVVRHGCALPISTRLRPEAANLRTRSSIALLAWEHARHQDLGVAGGIPAVVLGQAWRGGPQPQLARLLKGCVIESFDENAGRAVGRLLRNTGTSDVVDAHVVLTALRYRAAVLTSDPDDLQRLAATTNIRLRLHQV